MTHLTQKNMEKFMRHQGSTFWPRIAPLVFKYLLCKVMCAICSVKSFFFNKSFKNYISWNINITLFTKHCFRCLACSSCTQYLILEILQHFPGSYFIFLVPTSWFMVTSSWFLVSSSWFPIPSSWLLVPSSWFLVPVPSF